MQKQRVSRACDTCKRQVRTAFPEQSLIFQRRKIRCTGKQPCAHCIKNNKTCEFKAIYTRGAVPEIQSAPLEEQEKFLEEVGYNRRQVWRASPSRRTAAIGVRSVEDGGRDEEEESENGERGRGGQGESPSQTLPTRQHQEPTSSAFGYDISSSQTSYFQRDANDSSGRTSLYERRQHHLNRQSHHQKNPIAAYGDPLLPSIDTSFMILPSETTAQALITKCFDFISATNQFLHRPTVERWTSELLSNCHQMRTGKEEKSDECEDWDINTGFYYFQAAAHQLTQETGPILLPTIQSRLLQCHFLLSHSRINQCYSIFGTIITLIFTLNLHRSHHQTNTSVLLELEMQKRVFWSTYVMDKYLASALGRPQLLKDEDIDQELPSFVEDESLTKGGLKSARSASDGMVPVKGTVYQIKLSQILSRITTQLYTLPRNSPSLSTRLSSSVTLLTSLESWRSETSHFLQFDLGLLSPLYIRQNTVLRLSYLHARIVLHRPFLLDLFNTELDLSGVEVREEVEAEVERCIEASLEAVDLIDGMSRRIGKGIGGSWFTHHVANTAIIALYLRIIQLVSTPPSTSHPSSSHRHFPHNPSSHKPSYSYPVSPTSTFESINAKAQSLFETASKCQQQIKYPSSSSTCSTSSSTKICTESFFQKCTIVLEQAHSEVVLRLRLFKTHFLHSSSPHRSSSRSESVRKNTETKDTLTEGHKAMCDDELTDQMAGGRGRMSERRRIREGIEGETSFFGGEWGGVGFDQLAPGGGVLNSIFHGADGVRVRNGDLDVGLDVGGSVSLVERVRRLGFGGLSGC